MTPAERVGALPGFGFLWNHGILMAAFYAVLIGWGGMNLVALLLEHRVLVPSQQYVSFYKGDLFGLPVMMAAVAGMMVMLPEGHHWYQSPIWHVSWLVAALAIGVGFKAMEYKGGSYTLRQIL